jgi:BNR/Asp-box repeat
MATRIYAGAAHGTAEVPDRAEGGMYRMTIGDASWERLDAGLPEGIGVRAIAVHPRDARVIYAGTSIGPYRSTDGGDTWRPLAFSGPEREVWSLLFHPRTPEVMYAGTAPVAVYRSRDGGDSWTRLERLRAPGRVAMSFPCRVTRLAADPGAPDELYAGLEVDGVMRSLDGGESWDDVSHDLVKLAERPHLRSRIVSDTEIEGMMDSHALCVSGALPGTVFLATRMGLFRSSDRGSTWEDMEIGRFSPLTYARDVQVSPHDPRTLYTCLSPAARSEEGSLYRSDDLGQSWGRVDRRIKARATMMALALHPRDPHQVYCASRCGQVFGTQDGGKTWQEWPLPEGVGDVYTVGCAP